VYLLSVAAAVVVVDDTVLVRYNANMD